ncbi:MAG: ATP-binding cassette domain-containing protein, partial [Lachnospiraceae bacterium]|nr:ATP-binding cassette domain-containing protein [Lachnospiraceae bacterium]
SAEEKAKLKEEIAKNREEIKKALQVQKKEKVVDKVQMIFQDPIASLDPRMTVREIIGEGLIIRGEKDKKVIDERVYEALEKVGLVREHAGRYPHEFSGGQRQRIGIARSVIMHPEMIIADEPVSALDVSIQAQVINLLNDLRSEYGITIMFIAHDLSVVKYFSDRIGVMYYGKMVELASSDELFAHPLHPYTKSLLSAIPLPDPESEKKRKRLVYNKLKDHDYSVQGPTMREIVPGHFVYCNDEEAERYKKECEA